MSGITPRTVTQMLRTAGQVCILERQAPTGALDRQRQPVKGAFAAYAPYGDGLTRVRCFLETVKPVGEQATLQVEAVVNEYRLYLAGNPDVTEADRLHGVTIKKTGAAVNPRPIGIYGIDRPSPALTILSLREVR